MNHLMEKKSLRLSAPELLEARIAPQVLTDPAQIPMIWSMINGDGVTLVSQQLNFQTGHGSLGLQHTFMDAQGNSFVIRTLTNAPDGGNYMWVGNATNPLGNATNPVNISDFLAANPNPFVQPEFLRGIAPPQ